MIDLKRVDAYMNRVEQSIRHTTKSDGKRLKVGLDLGTAYLVLLVLDEDDRPIACELQAADVLRDGVVVDYTGSMRIVRDLKQRLEKRIGSELRHCAIAMPSGMESSVRTHRYVAEGAGLEVLAVLDEPSAANAIYRIDNGAVVDIGGGTTGIALLQNGKVVRTFDEPTGGTHLSLVIAGNRHISFAEAEAIKMDRSRHREILPIVQAVIEKMALIIRKAIGDDRPETVYLCGGTSCLTGIETIIEQELGIRTVKPQHPFLVTPAGIAASCPIQERSLR